MDYRPVFAILGDIGSLAQWPCLENALGTQCFVKDLCEKYPELTDPRHETEVVDLAEGDSEKVFFQRIVDEVENLSQLHLAGHVTTLEDVQKVLQVIWTASRCAERFYLSREFDEERAREEEVNENSSIQGSDSTLRVPSTPFPYESSQETGHLASDVGAERPRELEAIDEWNEESELDAMMLRIREQLEHFTHAPIPCCATGHELKEAQVDADVTCSLCKLSSSGNSGCTFLGCRLCEFDVCFNCRHKGATLPPECNFQKLRHVLQLVGVLKSRPEPEELRLLDSMALTMVLDDVNQATWAQDMRKFGNQLIGKNKLNLAAKFLQRSLWVAQNLMVEVHLDMGRLQMIQGDWQAALISLQDSLDMQSKTKTSLTNQSVALTLQCIGMVTFWQQQHEVAKACLQLSLSVRQELCPRADAHDQSKELLKRGLEYWEQNPQSPEAETALNESLKMVLPSCSVSFPSGLQSLENSFERKSLAVYGRIANILHDCGIRMMKEFPKLAVAGAFLQCSLDMKRLVGPAHVACESLALTLYKLAVLKWVRVPIPARKAELTAEICELLDETRSIYEKQGPLEPEAKKTLSMALRLLSYARRDVAPFDKGRELWISAGHSVESWISAKF